MNRNWIRISKLSAALWAYRTIYKVTTRTTSFCLVYVFKAILPIEVEIQSLRITVDKMLDVLKSISHCLETLEGLSEAWILSTQHIETYQ